MRHLAILVILLLAVPAMSVELFRYRYKGADGGQYEAVFETDEQSVGKAVDKEKAVEIAMAWMQAFYGEQVGTIESQELKTKPVPHWLFRLTVDDPVERTYFVVLPGKEVPAEEIVRGFEVERDNFVVISDDELKEAAPEKSAAIEIQEFVNESQIPTLYFEKPYYLEPDKGAGKAYALLREALAKSDCRE